METYREWRYSSIIINLGTRWRWMVSFTPPAVLPQEKAPGTRRIWGWVGPRASMDAVEKNLLSLPRMERRFPACPATSRHYADWAIPAQKVRRLSK
jgi:hypothetical protein